ncbi:GTPase ObgE [Candidatus Kaiserbacteria bacterium]|nr:GTPase ObgE [Candidatus Kaiserbacteria bacterium]
MFVDELTITAAAGNGGDGVVRWRHEKFKPMAGPAGGNGGRGGDVYVRAVKDPNRLAKYTGNPTFAAEPGEPGRNDNQYGHNGADIYIEIPAGSRVTDIERERVFEVLDPGEEVKILTGGSGGFGNVHFKSDTNRSPEQSTKGNTGQTGRFKIEVSLVVDVGLIGLPNAGKSTTLNMITNAKSRIGAYPFTTLEPHLGDFHGYLIADIPGLIEGAAVGKGLGHTFLRHVSRTKMLLHVVSLDSSDPISDYYTIRDELNDYDKSLLNKEEWILLSKKDLVNKDFISDIVKKLEKNEKRVFVLSQNDAESYKKFATALSQYLGNVSA